MQIKNATIKNLTVRASPLALVQSGLILNLDAGTYSGSGPWIDTVDGREFTLYNSPIHSDLHGGMFTFNPDSTHYADGPSFTSTLTNWTVETWHYYTGVTTGPLPCLVTEIYTGGPINYTLGCLNTGWPNLQTGFYTPGYGWQATPGGINLSSGSWYQIVGTWDGTTSRLYVNGTESSSVTPGITPARGGSGIRLMRRWDNPDCWGGSLGVVNMYDRALNSIEITQNFATLRGRFGI